MRKKLLFNTEATYLATGYSRYGHELLKRLHESNKYSVAELGSYGTSEDPRSLTIPWKFYPNMPNKNDQKAQQEYNSSWFNQFGKWRWENACLDFKPNICLTIRDHWYDDYIIHSPLNRFYKKIWMPTCDSLYQKREWIEDYCKLDACLSYTDWAKDILIKQSGNRLKFFGTAPACADPNVFKPFPNKRKVKASLGINPDSIIIGTTMRNQKRKLYPQLFEDFKKYIENSSYEHSENIYLYLHTRYPDLGWNIPDLIKEFDISNRVMFTYQCKHCKKIKIQYYNDIICHCENCGNFSCCMPGSDEGVNEQDLNVIYNAFDIYLQYANSEGQGIPVVEAAYAGVPTVVVNFSGLCDYVKKIKSLPIEPIKLAREAETNLNRAIPDPKDLFEALDFLIKMPESVRRNLGFQSMNLAHKHYNWDITAKVWMDCIDSLETTDNWEDPIPNIIQPNTNIPEKLDNSSFVDFCILNILKRPDLLNSYFRLKILRDLNCGSTIANYGGLCFSDESVLSEKPNFTKFDRNDLINEFLKVVEFNNRWERERLARLK